MPSLRRKTHNILNELKDCSEIIPGAELKAVEGENSLAKIIQALISLHPALFLLHLVYSVYACLSFPFADSNIYGGLESARKDNP